MEQLDLFPEELEKASEDFHSWLAGQRNYAPAFRDFFTAKNDYIREKTFANTKI